MDLSIIIVNWNSAEFTKNCIVSLHSTIEGLDYEIIVVDNASDEDIYSALKESFPPVELISLEHNIGFARANNLGVEHSRGANILFLNPDTLVLNDAIQTMVSALRSKAGIGAVGCRLLNHDSTLQMSCVQPFPTLANQFFGIECLRRRWPRLPLWGMRALFPEDRNSLSAVDVVSGACLMMKREAYEQVGGFSTDYFMYGEEFDLCYKLRSAGWSVCHVPHAQVIHFGGQSTKKKEHGFADIVMRESVFKFLRKFHGKGYALLYRVTLLLSAVARLVMLAPLLAIPGGIVDREGAGRAFRKWRNIAAWSLCLEKLTQQLVIAQPNSNTAVKS
jgi:GT2 family glycosyltransferase